MFQVQVEDLNNWLINEQSIYMVNLGCGKNDVGTRSRSVSDSAQKLSGCKSRWCTSEKSPVGCSVSVARKFLTGV